MSETKEELEPQFTPPPRPVISRAETRRLQTIKRRKRVWRILRWSLFFLFMAAAAAAVLYEMQTSRLQARHLARLTAQSTWTVVPKKSDAIRHPTAGPYDKRLGYVDLPAFVDRLTASGYDVTAQAEFSPRMLQIADLGFYPPYPEKSQAGLVITDRTDTPIFSAAYPERVYARFEDVPETTVALLLFIENRELLDEKYPMKNPAVEWKRLAAAVKELAMSLTDPSRNVPGGSTLATQLEKFRHSPGGQTLSVEDKFRQMVSASLRAYLEGEKTLTARRRILLDFVNAMPLGAAPGFGEIYGLGDGLYAWYNADFAALTRILSVRPTGPDDPALSAWALSMKEVLSLFIAQRRPSDFLNSHRQALVAKTDAYLRLLANEGVITPWERDAALPLALPLQTETQIREAGTFLSRKGVNSVKANLLTLLGMDRIYDLNRLDLSVKSTIHQTVQDAATTRLKEMNEEAAARAAGLIGYHLLEKGDPAKVIYSLTLYEATEKANLVRIQTDTFDQPLNINSGIKLELGSSAKLRTLVTYLEVIAALHDRYAPYTATQLRTEETAPADHLSRWVIDYFLTSKNRDLTPMLAAAMQRTYSASPYESFYTGSGVHTFENFNPDDDNGIFTIQDAFRNSINLPFIRLMRDIVQYYKYQIPGIGDLLSDAKDPRRVEYLTKFADQEGTTYLRRFYRKYAGKSPEEALDLLVQNIESNPSRVAAAFRYVSPNSDLKTFKAFLSGHTAFDATQDAEGLFARYASGAYSLVDRGYIARIHPLELWVAAYLALNPKAGLSEVLAKSAHERQEVYGWLFKTSRKNKQDGRIRDLLEVEAFSEIHAAWKRLKYPFDSLVPSYATAIGSSADRPAALAELVGIIIRGGSYCPSLRVTELEFGKGTPYETRLAPPNTAPEQVLNPEVAAVVKEALLGVVSGGTAKRIYQSYRLPDGTILPIGGKTGTGDNRFETYGAGGRLISSKVINRTAVFVFFLGDRFFGTITAYVAGSDAADYSFTSSLPVQVLKVLSPTLMPLIEEPKEKMRN